MRFGIIPLDFNEAIKKLTSVNPLIRRSVSLKKYAVKAIESGFKHIEIPLDILQVYPKLLDKGALREILDITSAWKISISAHLPIWGIELSWVNEDIRRASVKTVVKSIKYVDILEPEYYVLHIAGKQVSEFALLSYTKKPMRKICKVLAQYAVRSIDEIVRKTDLDSELLALETVMFPYDLTLEVARRTGASFLVDTGHVLSGQCGNVDLYRILDEVKDMLVGIHLHDAYVKRDSEGNVIRRDHLIIGEGSLDILRFFNKLKEIGFNGPIVIELSLPGAIESLRRLHEIIPELFKV